MVRGSLVNSSGYSIQRPWIHVKDPKMNKTGAQSPAGISGRTRKGCNGTLTAMVISSTSSRKCEQRAVLDSVVKVTTLV